MRTRRAPFRTATLLVALVAVSGIISAQSRPEPRTPGPDRRHGRLFLPEDLGSLEGPDREAWQKPDRIMDALGIAEGSFVADLGAGGGWFTIRLARRVGPNGLVYAEDIQRQMIEAIDRRVRREEIRNVALVLGTAEDPRLPVAALDAALMVDAYHEVENKLAFLRNVKLALKPNGRIGIVEFKNDGGGPGPPMEQRIEPQRVIEHARQAGLRLISQETFLPYQYLLVFGT
jgi:ubiquinone/menaquinone biosynthesis C-methylase UbiE